MDEKKWLEKIQKSSEGIEAPEQLQPENIKKLLEENPGGKKKRWKRYGQWGAIAAAFALVIIGSVSGLTRFTATRENGEWKESGMDIAKESTEAARESTEAVKESQKAEKAEVTDYAFAGASTYREIYDALLEMQGGGMYARGGADNGAVAEMEEKAEDGAVPEAAAEDIAYDMETASASESAATVGGGYSKTNLQELGVDEADVLKTDGKYLYVLKATGKVLLIRAQRENLEIEGSIELLALNETFRDMYVDGDILNVIAEGAKTEMQQDEEDEDYYAVDTQNYTKLYTYDISDRAQPKLSGTVEQQGYYATSRKNGDYLYLFTQYSPMLKSASDIDGYVPAVNGARLESTDVYLPEYRNSSEYLVISSINNQKPDEILDKKAIVSAAENFYVSQENIYIANMNWNGKETMTQLLKFHYEDGSISAVATGDLKGYLNDTFSMNEYKGYLRIVLTDNSGETQRNALYVMNDSLEVTGSIQDIAEGEDIRSARFMGDTGYFVTFRNMDPLFSVDLSDPQNPKLLGELKITGFSSYLHFYGENLLLGVGDEVDPETGAYLGIKLSMFDISNPADVKEVHKYVLKDVYDCSLLYNYKDVMIDVEKNVFGARFAENYMIFSYDEENGFENVFTENVKDIYYSSYYDGISGARGCYIDDTLYLVGGGQIRIYDMADGYKGLGRLEI